ncbi:MAG TPA: crosslink repair DNA glycosylase YcaQ family protein, partial [Polyangiaceae bacterium]
MAAKRGAANGVSADRVRAFWADRQGMGRGMKGLAPEVVLARTGWSRSVGGCNPYLALRDRAGVSRAATDAAVGEVAICELPAVRGCTYVVPKSDFAVALTASQGKGEDPEITTAKKYLGVTDTELERLSRKVLDAVAREALDPAGLKEALGGAVRSLGEEGKKRGVATTLPLVLGLLQAQGQLRRVAIEGRLDRQRYRYARWEPNPIGTARFAPGELAQELGRRFFRWAGPATVGQFAWWSGLGVKAARAAAQEIGVVPLGAAEEIDKADERLLFPDDRDALLALELPRAPSIAFVSALDNLVHLRREVLAHLHADDAAIRAPGPEQKGEKTSAASVGALVDLEYHPIVDRGRIVGLWDWDGERGELVWRTFGTAPKGAREEAAALSVYVAAELED